MNEFKLPKTMKVTFVLNLIAFLSGVIFQIDLLVATSAVIFVILSVATSILEGTHDGFERLIQIELDIYNKDKE